MTPRTTVAKALPILALALSLGGPAFAQQAGDPTGAPPPLTAFTDATLRALKERRVTLTVGRDQVTGRLLGFEADSITIARDDGNVMTIPRSTVLAIRLDEAERPAPVPPPPPPPPTARELPPAAVEDEEPPGRPRYFGVHLGMAPGVALDLDYGYFHAFASTSWLFPLVSNGQLVAFTAGLGASIPLSPRWRFDVFGHVAPLFESVSGYSSGFNTLNAHVGFGVGMGLHYTAPSGFSIGVKLPVIGAATTAEPNATVASVVGYYYLASALSLPIFSVGYRF